MPTCSVAVSSRVTQSEVATRAMAHGVAQVRARAVVLVPRATLPRTSSATISGRAMRSTTTEGTIVPKPCAQPSRVR